MDCIWKKLDDGRLQCVHCDWVFPRPYDKDLSTLHRNCPQMSDEKLAVELKPIAENLGVPSDMSVMYQMFAQWRAIGYPYRINWKELSTAECDTRLENGCCRAIGCSNGEKKTRCEWLAKMESVGNCPKGHFGNQRQAVAAEIQKAMVA